MRRVPVTLIALLVVSLVLLPADSNIAADALPAGWQPYLWLAWPIGVLLAVPLIIWELRKNRAPGVSTDVRVTLGRAEGALADLVDEQWTAEAGWRSLAAPEPIRVRWSVVDSPTDVQVAPALSRVVEVPDGRLWQDDVEISELVAALHEVKARQLIVLGAPAAGKSVVALLLTLELLRGRLDGEPVPVPLVVSRWNPHRVALRDWLADVIGTEYPALGNVELYGKNAVARLIAAKRVLPVLDGLDEMPERVRSAAITAIDQAVADQYPLVVTCRRDEYEAAVRRSGRFLSHAAVVVLHPVDIRDAEEFLRGSDAEPQRWQQVINHVRARPDSPVAAALRSPLMIDLARTAYADRDRDPAALLDTDTFPDSVAVQRHLFDAFLGVAYGSDRPPGSQPGSTLASYPPPRAIGWLRFLARNLPAHDIAWWKLAGTMRRSTCAILAGLLVALVFGLTQGLP